MSRYRRISVLEAADMLADMSDDKIDIDDSDVDLSTISPFTIYE